MNNNTSQTNNSNVGISVKKFLTNKNTVSIIGVVLIILVLYIGYNIRIKSMTDPTPIPYAVQTLKPGTKITSDYIGTVNVPKALLSKDVITNSRAIVGKYVSQKSVIPAGSMFYNSNLVETLSATSLDYPENYVLVNLNVNTNTTYGNLIYPGDYIDIYLRIQYSAEGLTEEDSNKLTVGKLLSNVKVLRVIDASGNDVFADLDNKGTPAQIVFALPSDYHILLRKAIYLRTYSSTIIPVPTKVDETEEVQVTIGSTELESFINRVTAWTDDNSNNNVDNQIDNQVQVDVNNPVVGQ